MNYISVKETKDLYETNSVLTFGDQLKMIIHSNLDVFRSMKRLKGVYAHLQSLLPDLFDSSWIGRFFGPRNSNIQDELSTSLLAGDIWEGLWTCYPPKCEYGRPIHHVYGLNGGRSQSEIADVVDSKGLEEIVRHEIQPTVLAWNTLDTKFSVFWMYLLEIYSHLVAPENEAQLKLLPTKEEWDKSEGEDTSRIFSDWQQFTQSCELLCKDFDEMKLKGLKMSSWPISSEMKIYSRLSDAPSDQEISQFFSYYRFLEKNTGRIEVEINKTEAKVKIAPDKVRSFYEYLTLDKTLVTHKFKCLDKPENGSGSLLDLCKESDIMEEISADQRRYLKGNEDKRKYVESIKNRGEQLAGLDQDILKTTASKIEQYVTLLRKHYKLAGWRHARNMSAVEEMAAASQKYPVLIRFPEVEKAQARHLAQEKYNLCLDPTKDWSEEIRNYLTGTLYEKGGFHAGMLSHLQHILGPVDIARIVFAGKVEEFMKGGLVILDQ